LVLYIACIISFVWRTTTHGMDCSPISDHALLAARIAMTVLLGMGGLHSGLILLTFLPVWQRHGQWLEEAYQGVDRARFPTTLWPTCTIPVLSSSPLCHRVSTVSNPHGGLHPTCFQLESRYGLPNHPSQGPNQPENLPPTWLKSQMAPSGGPADHRVLTPSNVANKPNTKAPLATIVPERERRVQHQTEGRGEDKRRIRFKAMRRDMRIPLTKPGMPSTHKILRSVPLSRPPKWIRLPLQFNPASRTHTTIRLQRFGHDGKRG
jgi:hypothetical protein